MFAKRMIPAEFDVESDNNDENKELVEFYESNLPRLMKCRLEDVKYDAIEIIVVQIEANKSFDDNWQGYATKMGITDTHTLNKIKVNADCKKVPPMIIVMKELKKKNVSLGTVIKSLLDSSRLDILMKIQHYVEELLVPTADSESKRTEPANQLSLYNHPGSIEKNTPSSLQNERLDTNSVLFLPTSSYDNPKNCCAVKSKQIYLDQFAKIELNTLEQQSVNTRGVCAPQINKLFSELNVEDIGQTPTAPPSSPEVFKKNNDSDEKLTVLILHTEFEDKIAQQLSLELTREGMTVTTLSDVNNLTAYDASTALNVMFNEADFIVPVVSDSFLQQTLYPHDHDLYLESTYAMNNRNLYQMMVHEYRSNRCVNFRVRPVMVPEMKRKNLTKDVILSISLRLWNGVPTLVRILKESKARGAQQLVS